MDFDHFLHYLAKEGFADQEVDIVNGVMYPSTEMIISIHNFLIKYCKDQNDQIQSGIHSEGNIEFGLLHIKEQVSSNIY